MSYGNEITYIVKDNKFAVYRGRYIQRTGDIFRDYNIEKLYW